MLDFLIEREEETEGDAHLLKDLIGLLDRDLQSVKVVGLASDLLHSFIYKFGLLFAVLKLGLDLIFHLKYRFVALLSFQRLIVG
jgi:hypothetical protein